MAHMMDAVLRLRDEFSGTLKEAREQSQRFQKEWDRVGRNLEKSGRQFQRVGKTLTAAVTLPLAGIGGAALKTGMEFEQGMAEVQAISGASAGELALIEEKARDIGKNTKLSASQVAEAFKYTSMAGWDAQQSLAAMDGITNLAIASNEDLATVSDIVTDSITAMGLAAEDTNHFVDVLAAAASNSNTNVAMMGETFKYAAPMANTLGYSIEDLALATGLMANAGIKETQAGTSLRTALSNLAKPSGEAQKAMDQLGISLTDKEGKMLGLRDVMQNMRKGFAGLSEDEKAAAASAIFGKNAMAGMLAIINAGDEDFNKLSEAIDNSTGTAEKMRKVMEDTLGGSFDSMKSAIEGVLLDVFDIIAPIAQSIIEKVTELANWFSEDLSEGGKKAIVVFLAIAAAVGPVLLIIGKLLMIFGRLHKNMGTIKVGMTAFKTVLAGIGPIGLAIVAVIALIVGAVKLWGKYGDDIKEKFGNAFDSIKQGLEGLKDKFSAIWDGIKEGFANFVESAKELIGGLLTFLIEVFLGGLMGFINRWVGAFNLIIDFIRGPFLGAWSSAWNSIKDTFTNVFSTIADFGTRSINKVIDGINWIVGKFGGKRIQYVGGGSVGSNATGTQYWKGGLTRLHERGDEIVHLQRGSKVIPHGESLRTAFEDGKASTTGGSIQVNFGGAVFHVREESDINSIAEAVVAKLAQASKVRKKGVPA